MFTKLAKVIKVIDNVREKHNPIFMRLSSISAKDKTDIDWCNWSTQNILSAFITSWRIQEDLDEALRRCASVSLCLLPWKTFSREYRTFVTKNVCWTRDNEGNLITDEQFQKYTRLLLERMVAPFVFDMGECVEYGLTFIECNQFDETCDLYLPDTGLSQILGQF